MDPDPDEEEIGDVVLDADRERNWRMVSEGNNGGVDGMKALIHSKKWDLYNSEKEVLVMGGH